MHSLLCRESPDVEQDELVIPLVQTTEKEVAPVRPERASVDRPPPHLHVPNSKPKEISAGHSRGRVRTQSPPVEATDVIGDDGAESWSTVRFSVATEVGVVRRNLCDSRTTGGCLAETSDHEFGGAVHEIGLELVHRPGDATIRRRR